MAIVPINRGIRIMGISAYNRGTLALIRRLDREYNERQRVLVERRIYIHEYINCINGETVRCAYDAVGPLVNQKAYFDSLK